MLAEPDLFSCADTACPSSLHNLCSLEPGHESAERDSVTVVFDDKNIITIQTLESSSHQFDRQVKEFPSQERGLKCHSDSNLGIKYLLSNERQTNTISGSGILTKDERKARRWYLIVIVLLYVGLVTSFCLNVSLLLKNYPEHAASVKHLSQQHLQFDGMKGE